MSLLVSLVARYTTSIVLPNEEVIILGLAAGIVFAILDMYAPSIQVNI